MDVIDLKGGHSIPSEYLGSILKNQKLVFVVIKIIQTTFVMKFTHFLVSVLVLGAVKSMAIENCEWSKVDSHNTTRCTICQPSHASNLNYTQCNPCSQLHPQCLKCQLSNSQLQCQLCNYGYQMGGNTCQKVHTCDDPQCLSCSLSPSKCQYCDTGFFLNLSSQTCMNCPYPDQLDNFDQTCSCDFGYYLSTSNNPPKCQPCAYPCQLCHNSPNNCSQCIYGFYQLSTGNCAICLAPNCIVCLEGTTCLACTLGYRLIANECHIQLQTQNIDHYINLPQFYYFCEKGCFYCYKYDFCLTCLEGYSRNLYNDSCMICPQGCQRCESVLDMKCFSCYSGYRLFNSTCLRCSDPNCLNCEGNQTHCLTCENGFGMFMGQCKACAENCLNCDMEGQNKCDINGCGSGFARVNVNQCAACALGCYSCSPVDISTCIDCPLGSFQIQGGQCQVCPSSCITCLSSTHCQSCRQNHRLVNNICYQNCVYPCLQCSLFNTKICHSCFKGYKINQNYECMADLSCNTISNCTICPVGHYLTLHDSKCHTCQLQQHCIKCQTQTDRCVICQPGYYVIQNQCQSCNSNCQICQLFDRCFSCNPGYYLQKSNPNQVYGHCLACSPICLTCIDQTNKCNSCPSDKVLIGFSCITSQNIIFQITMQHQNIQQQNSQEIAFIKQIVAFTKHLAILIGPPYDTHPQLLYIKDISSGSIRVTYMASISNMDPRVLLRTVTLALSEFKGYRSFRVLGTKIVANGFQTDSTISPPDAYLYISLVPSPFFVVFLFMLVSTCMRQRTKMEPQTNGASSEQKDPHRRQIVLEPMQSEKNLRGQAHGAITL